MFLHFDDLKRDLESCIRVIADFLEIQVSEQELLNAVSHSTFEYMKKNEHLFEPPAAIMSPGAFINKGVTGRWKNVLSPEQKALMNRECARHWSPECLAWVNRDYEAFASPPAKSPCERM